MQIRARDIFKFEIAANDGPCGTLSDILFDIRNWKIRYFAVNLSKTGSAKIALCPFELIANINPINEIVRLLGNPPHIKSQNQPNRSKRGYDFSLWPTQFSSFIEFAPHFYYPLLRNSEDKSEQGETRQQYNIAKFSSSLISLKEIMGYRLLFNNSGHGRVSDFILNTSSGKIESMVVRCRRFLSRIRIELPTVVVRNISWEMATVSVFIDDITAKDFERH